MQIDTFLRALKISRASQKQVGLALCAETLLVPGLIICGGNFNLNVWGYVKPTNICSTDYELISNENSEKHHNARSSKCVVRQRPECYNRVIKSTHSI